MQNAVGVFSTYNLRDVEAIKDLLFSEVFHMNRRIFLMAGSGVALAQSPAETLHLGLIGAGGRGRRVMTHFADNPRVKTKAVCDIYEPNLEKGLSDAGAGTKAYRNYKKLLDDPEIDVACRAPGKRATHALE